MKKNILIIGLLIGVLFLSSCAKAKGSYLDFAAIKDAQRTMVKLTNLMEQYYVEHDTYPESGDVFVKEIKPYFITYNRKNEPVDKWKEMVEDAFVDGKLYYNTDNPKEKYFIYGKAKDSNGTIVYCRPAMLHKEGENKIETKKK